MQTEESLARLRLFIAVFRVGDGLVYDRTLKTALAKHLIHEQGSKREGRPLEAAHSLSASSYSQS